MLKNIFVFLGKIFMMIIILAIVFFFLVLSAKQDTAIGVPFVLLAMAIGVSGSILVFQKTRRTAYIIAMITGALCFMVWAGLFHYYHT